MSLWNWFTRRRGMWEYERREALEHSGGSPDMFEATGKLAARAISRAKDEESQCILGIELCRHCR